MLVDLGKVARRHEEKHRFDREIEEIVPPAMQLTYQKTLLASPAPLICERRPVGMLVRC